MTTTMRAAFQRASDRMALSKVPPQAPNPAAPAAPKRAAEAPAAGPAARKPARKDGPPSVPFFVREFKRLSALVEPGRWPATLPTGPGFTCLPVAIGIARRVAEMLPEGERKALFVAVKVSAQEPARERAGGPGRGRRRARARDAARPRSCHSQ